MFNFFGVQFAHTASSSLCNALPYAVQLLSSSVHFGAGLMWMTETRNTEQRSAESQFSSSDLYLVTALPGKALQLLQTIRRRAVEVSSVL